MIKVVNPKAAKVSQAGGSPLNGIPKARTKAKGKVKAKLRMQMVRVPSCVISAKSPDTSKRIAMPGSVSKASRCSKWSRLQGRLQVRPV